jgi:HAD superfamily hydrolase (TIGR01549 family)
MAFRVVFFDFGGTLVDISGPPRERVWSDLLQQQLQRELPSDALLEALQRADATYMPLIYSYHGRLTEFWHLYDGFVLHQLGVPSEAAERLLPLLDEAFRKVAEGYTPYPETHEVLESLRARGYRLGVISNFTDDLPWVLERLALNRYFMTVVYSQQAGVDKPDPRIFQVALERAGCAAHEAVHVGDSYEADVLGARAAGLTPIFLDRDDHYAEADCTRVRDLRGLLPLLDAGPMR